MNVRQILRTIKRLPLYALFGRWRTQSDFEPGYTIALPMPMDMPFLLRLALEGLAGLNTPNCKQILIVPDGWGNDNGRALAEVIRDFDDPRLELVNLRSIDYRVIRAMRPPGCACTHWMLVVNSVLNARHEYILLHDADAFFLSADGLEKQYSEALFRKMEVLGVTSRWDAFFTERDMSISGTWEILLSARWARKRSPLALFPGKWSTAYGDFGFDSTLYAQFLDYDSGTIGVMQNPPEFVHFNGTIFTYRTYRDRTGESVTDELFRILLLSAIETALGVPKGGRTTPLVAELEQGLVDHQARVNYCSSLCSDGYAEFRTMVNQMISSPAFGGERAKSITTSLHQFDQHFGFSLGQSYNPALQVGQVRQMGLGQSPQREQ